MIKTAIIGASGFLGSYLIKNYRSQYPDCIGTSYSNRSPKLLSFDIKNPNIKNLNLERTGHKAVIIASYISKIPKYENELLKACEVNVDGVLKLIKNLSKTSFSIPQKVKLVLQGNGFEKKWEIKELKDSKPLVVKLSSKKSSPNNKFKASLVWEDNSGMKNHLVKTLVIKVEGKNVWENIKIWFNGLINIFV